jgi:2-polyprenyl-3-methyl-5-hydroxy-6-metoxy-1,4-benzoquinol methylase
LARERRSRRGTFATVLRAHRARSALPPPPARASIGPPPAPVEDYESGAAVRAIARALPPVERAYALVRFGIFRTKFLALMNLILPEEGRILDVGCGFGLFSVYFALLGPRRALRGVDPDARRVRMAERVAAALGVGDRAGYQVASAERLDGAEAYDAVYMLDVLHHLPAAEQIPVLRRLRDRVAPGGVLLIKEVTTDSPWRLKFTELLDRAMVGPDEPLNYRHHQEWADILRWLGFAVRTVRVPDVLPYPHVVLVARRPSA